MVQPTPEAQRLEELDEILRKAANKYAQATRSALMEKQEIICQRWPRPRLVRNERRTS